MSTNILITGLQQLQRRLQEAADANRQAALERQARDVELKVFVTPATSPVNAPVRPIRSLLKGAGPTAQREPDKRRVTPAELPPLFLSVTTVSADPELSRAASFTVFAYGDSLLVPMAAVPRGYADTVNLPNGGRDTLLSDEGFYSETEVSARTRVTQNEQAKYVWAVTDFRNDVVQTTNTITVTYAFRYYKDYVYVSQEEQRVDETVAVTMPGDYESSDAVTPPLVKVGGEVLGYGNFAFTYSAPTIVREKGEVTLSVAAARLTRSLTSTPGVFTYTLEEVTPDPAAVARILPTLQIIVPRADTSNGPFDYVTGVSSSYITGAVESLSGSNNWLADATFVETRASNDVAFCVAPYTPEVLPPP